MTFASHLVAGFWLINGAAAWWHILWQGVVCNEIYIVICNVLRVELNACHAKFASGNIKLSLPVQRQPIIWTNSNLLSIKHLWTEFSDIKLKMQENKLKILSAKWRPFCLGFDVLIPAVLQFQPYMVACLDFLYQLRTLISKLLVCFYNVKTFFRGVMFSSLLRVAMRCVGIIFLIVGHFNMLCETCRTTYTQQPLVGYRCVLNNSSIVTNLASIGHAQCHLTCLSRNSCIVISYNHIYNYCDLADEICNYLEPNEEFTVNLYGKDRRNCHQWVPLTEYDPQRAVAFLNGPSYKNIVAVARVSHNTGIYPGKYQRYKYYKLHVVLNNGNMIIKYDGEVLLADPDCYTAWLAYSIPNTMPAGAVGGGQIGDETLYVGRAMRQDGKYAIGYFRKNAGLYYYFDKPTEVVKNDTMEILVLL